MAIVTSLTASAIEELMAGWEGVALSQDELSALVQQLWTNNGTQDVVLTEFRDVTLPQLRTDLANGSILVSDLNDNLLPELQQALDQNQLSITNLQTVDLPSLNDRLNSNSNWILEFEEVTVPDLNARLDANDASLLDLNTVTLPGLQTRLSDLEAGGGGGVDLTEIEARLDVLDGKFPITGPDIAANTIAANNILADTITANEIASRSITALELVADTITANEIASRTITALELVADTITANEIASNAITANEINAGAVTTAKIFAGAVTANEIGTNAITAIKVNAGAITTEKIFAGAVTANEIATDAITAVKIKAGEVVAGKLATNAVVAANIAAGQVVAGKLATDSVVAANIQAGQITSIKIETGAVVADKIATGAVVAGKIAAGAVQAGTLSISAQQEANLVVNGGFEDNAAGWQNWSGGAPNAYTEAGFPKKSGAVGMTIPGSGTIRQTAPFPVSPGDLLSWKFWAVQNYLTAGLYFRIHFTTDDGNSYPGSGGTTYIDTVSNSIIDPIGGKEFGGQITVPAGYTWARVYIYNTGGSYIGIDDVSITKTPLAIQTGKSGARIEIKLAPNPFQSNTSWGLIQIHNESADWYPGQIWGQYNGSSEGQLSLTSPFLSTQGAATAARIALVRNSITGRSRMDLTASDMSFTADTFGFYSTAGNVDFNLLNTNGFQIKQGAGAGQGLNFAMGVAGVVTLTARWNNAGKPRLDLDGAGINLYGGPNGVTTTGSGIYVQNGRVLVEGQVEIAGSQNTLKIGAPPSAGAANVNYNATNGLIRLATSTRRHKENIDAIDFNVDTEMILSLQPHIYQRIDRMEGDPDWEIGFIAEEALEAGLDHWVDYDGEGEPIGFDYYKWAVALQVVARAQRDEINDLQGRLQAVEELLSAA